LVRSSKHCTLARARIGSNLQPAMSSNDRLLATDWGKLVAPKLYDPPQFKKSWQPCGLGNINWMTRDSPMCNSFPCCLSQCMITCCLKPCFRKQPVELSNPDEWFLRMLQAENPSCPEHLKGLWWMQGNIVPEQIAQFSDGDWVAAPEQEEMIGTKKLYQNWAYGTNAFASILSCFNAARKFETTLAKHGKWAALGGDAYMVLLEEANEIVNPDGTVPRYTPGVDWMRLTWTDSSLSELKYQYLMRRIAYLDGQGKLVKTDAYSELMEKTSLPGVQGCCCNYGLCNIPVDKYPQIWQPESNVVLLEFAPPRTKA